MRRVFDRLLFRRAKGDASLTGRAGERYAERCLKGLGFRLICRNWRSGRDELDLVMADGDVLVFVEVKTRKEAALVSPYHSVGRGKKKALQRACRSYIRSLKNRPRTFRFDIAAVSVSENGDAEFRHFKNVPLFPKDYI